MGKPEWAIPGLLFSDTFCIFCTVALCATIANFHTQIWYVGDPYHMCS